LLVMLAAPNLVSRGLATLWASPEAAALNRQLAVREAAAAIRRDTRDENVVVWSSPNLAHDVAFYGNFGVLGTLYWENAAGLRTMAEIAGSSEEEAMRLMRRRGVTHVALTFDDDWGIALPDLLWPERTEAERQRSFGYQLLVERRVPWWLEALSPTDGDVRVYRVRLAEGFSPETVTQLERRLASSSPEERYRLLTQAGATLQSAGQRARAVEYLRRALNERVTDLDAAVRLAWILSTAPEAEVRQPEFAVQLARQCVRLDAGSAEAQHALAAALAATGEFAEAVEAIERAVALRQRAGKVVPEGWARQREAYRQYRAWMAE